MGNGTPHVSVVVATHNRGAILRENVNSVLAQDFDDYEVVYANDDSTDDTAEVLASFGDRVRVVQGAWHAPGPARNAGVDKARGRLLLFTDDDC
ncbi:MAG: glycosyltransferase family 2 protein, partial [bacterium]|nr:glycosyltransferase family 2 protein [bacterium]